MNELRPIKKIVKKSYQFNIPYTQNIDPILLFPHTRWTCCPTITGKQYHYTGSSQSRRLYYILSSLLQYSTLSQMFHILFFMTPQVDY